MTPWKRRPEIHLWSRAVQAAGTFDIDVPRPLHLRALGVTRISLRSIMIHARAHPISLSLSFSLSISLSVVLSFAVRVSRGGGAIPKLAITF